MLIYMNLSVYIYLYDLCDHLDLRIMLIYLYCYLFVSMSCICGMGIASFIYDLAAIPTDDWLSRFVGWVTIRWGMVYKSVCTRNHPDTRTIYVTCLSISIAIYNCLCIPCVSSTTRKGVDNLRNSGVLEKYFQPPVQAAVSHCAVTRPFSSLTITIVGFFTACPAAN